MRKIIVFITLLAILQFPSGCDDCGDTTRTESRITSLYSEVGAFDSAEGFLYEQSISFDKAAILIDIDDLEINEIELNFLLIYWKSNGV